MHLSHGLEKAMLSVGLTLATYNSNFPFLPCLAKTVNSLFSAHSSAWVEWFAGVDTLGYNATAFLNCTSVTEYVKSAPLGGPDGYVFDGALHLPIDSIVGFFVRENHVCV
jgi:hypothetical protein